MSTISERVARGVAWLDSMLPEWWKTLDVDPGQFDLKSGCSCVVGQLYAQDPDAELDTWESAFDMALNTAWLDLSWEMAEEFGFYAGTPFSVEHDADYRALEAEWVRVITERRAAA